MVVFGGGCYSGNTSTFVNDVWALSLADTPAWTRLWPSGAPPSGRYGQSAIYDPVRDRMVVFGGGSFSPPYRLNDVWALSLAGTPNWTQSTPSGTPPSTRLAHSAIYDPARDCMVVFGGEGSTYFNDTWALWLAGASTWTQLTPSGTPPSARWEQSAVHDPLRNRVVMFGGNSNASSLNDVWTLGLVRIGNSGVEPQPSISDLRPPAPNPTHGTTAVSFALAQSGRVQLGVYDVSGRLVRQLVDGERPAGTETVVWNGTAGSGTRVDAGVYFVRLSGPWLRRTRRVILLR